MFPRSGGIYVFIREAFGPLPAFLFGWGELLIIRPGAYGAISITSSAYTLRVLGLDPAAPALTLAGQTVRAEQLLAAVFVGVVADRKSTRLNSSHSQSSYAVFCLK